MTAPLTGIQRIRLDALVVQLTERRMHTKAADLRQALEVIDAQEADNDTIAAQRDVARRAVAAYADQLVVVLDILADFVQVHGDCRLDHNGTCQEHFLEPAEVCMVKRSRSALRGRATAGKPVGDEP